MAYFGFRDEARYGLIMSVASIGSIVMTILLGLFGERINKIHGIGFGLALMGVTAILIGAMPLYIGSGAGYTLMLFYSLLAGIGYITIDLLMNGVVADVYPEKKDTFLPYVHAFYGMAAVLFLIFLMLDVNFNAARIILMCIGFLQGAAIPSLVILCCDAFPERNASASSVIVLGVSLVAPVAKGAMIEQSGYMLPMLVITACLPLSVAVTAFAGRKQ